MTTDRPMGIEVTLEPCPFCAKPLEARTKINPVAQCNTEGCWLADRKISIAVDDPRQVAAWNTRQSSIASLTGDVGNALTDPNAVHVNMLRGGIARPSIAQIIHIYGEDALRAALTTPPAKDDAGRLREAPRTVGWVYDIKHGPEGEAEYAWVYDENRRVVAVMKTQDATRIATPFSALSPQSDEGEERRG